MVAKRLAEYNTQERDLEKLGIDVDDVAEIAPVNFHGYNYEKNPIKKQISGSYVSPRYELIWVFFSDSQMFTYKCAFDMFNNFIDESTQEYFYKDVTSFKTATAKPEESDAEDLRYERFTIIIPGDNISVSMTGTEQNSSDIIFGMKQKLRKKKNA